MDDYSWLILGTGGLISGTISGLLGIGGGIVTIPLMIALGYSPVQAIATSSLFIVMTSISGSIQNWMMGYLSFRKIMILGIPAFITTGIGVHFANRIPPHIILAAFGVILVMNIYLIELRKQLATNAEPAIPVTPILNPVVAMSSEKIIPAISEPAILNPVVAMSSEEIIPAISEPAILNPVVAMGAEETIPAISEPAILNPVVAMGAEETIPAKSILNPVVAIDTGGAMSVIPASNPLLYTIGTGSIAGIMAGLFGLGGGTVMVPLQILLLGEPIKAAIQTSLGVIVITALAAYVGHSFEGNIILIPGVILGIGGVLGAQLSTRVLPKLPDQIVRLALRFFLGILAIYVFWQSWVNFSAIGA
jgi:uncharacterized protein